MATIRVVSDREGAGPRGNGVCLCPEFLGLVSVVGQDLRAGDRVVVAIDDRGGEVLGRGTGTREDGVGDGVAVDRVGDCLATQVAFFTGEVFQGERNCEGLEDCCRLIHGATGEVCFVGGECRVRKCVEDVKVAGEQILVGGIERGVEDNVHATVLGNVVTLVLRIRDQVDLSVVLPAAFGDHVGAVTNGLLATGFHVFQGRVRKREVCGVAEALREVSCRGLKGNGERVVVNDLEAGQIAGAFIIGASNRLEEVGGEHRFRCTLLPCVNEVVCFDLGAVGELLSFLQLDGPHARIFVRLDGFGHFHMGCAGCIVVNEACEDGVEDPAATGFVGVCRNQRVLWLRAVDRNDAGRRACGYAGSV